MRYVFFPAIIMLIGCVSNAEDANVLLLESKVKAYLDCDELRDFQCMWLMRTPGFRRSVPIEVYERESKLVYEDWKTIEWKIIGTKLHDEDLGEVVYDIKEKIPGGLQLAGKDVGGKTALFRETMEWWKIDDDWYVLDVGYRGRIAFSGGVEQTKIVGR